MLNIDGQIISIDQSVFTHCNAPRRKKKEELSGRVGKVKACKEKNRQKGRKSRQGEKQEVRHTEE